MPDITIQQDCCLKINQDRLCEPKRRLVEELKMEREEERRKARHGCPQRRKQVECLLNSIRFIEEKRVIHDSQGNIMTL